MPNSIHAKFDLNSTGDSNVELKCLFYVRIVYENRLIEVSRIFLVQKVPSMKQLERFH